ncbi:hypothetical protein P3T76_008348 [Phytophthora citrophthora]|uniref:Uncharacterized protein n=1 Tax=Phytophthora citrophthora TaxID=4793 RepID=A0AAD9LKP2_9STRA|nr:hypothetical protein P3T76_008348 [Phytophthora citrophthora]
MLQVRGKGNLAGQRRPSPKFTNKPCNPSSPNQISSAMPHQGVRECLQDGAVHRRWRFVVGCWYYTAHLWYCDANNQNQWFDMDSNTVMLKIPPVMDILCLDDGNGWTRRSKVGSQVR